MGTPQWKHLLDLVQAIPERIYETWSNSEGWDNDNLFGREYGENGVSWCVIFDWVMYNRAGLSSVVPHTDNVSYFSDWAQRRGQWSEYPSVGAWVNLGAGAHTEIVVGFDEELVYTKGGNSVRTGAADNGQGNGVWSHSIARRAARVTGYFAPRFPDGICPPTADPNDPRGGRAVASYRWPGPSAPDPTPEETDMTPAQEAKLDKAVSLCEKVLAVVNGPGNMAYRNPDQDAASVKSTGQHIPDVYAYIQRTDGNAAAIRQLLGTLQTTGLSDAQMDVLVDKLGDSLAARLAN